MELPGRALLQDIEDTREQAGLCGSLFWKPDRVGVSEDRREGFFTSAVFWEPRAQGSLACHCVRRDRQVSVRWRPREQQAGARGLCARVAWKHPAWGLEPEPTVKHAAVR